MEVLVKSEIQKTRPKEEYKSKFVAKKEIKKLDRKWLCT